MTTDKELERSFARWLRKQYPNKALSERFLSTRTKIFITAINKGREHPPRPDHKTRNRKLAPLAAILKDLPVHTKNELADMLAFYMYGDFTEYFGEQNTFFNSYKIKNIALRFFEKTAIIAETMAEMPASERQWKNTDAPFITLCVLRMNFSLFTKREATAADPDFQDLAEIALLAFDGVTKPSHLIGKVFKTDYSELNRIVESGN